MPTKPTTTDDPAMTPEQIEQANSKVKPAPRGPLDPITRHLWRAKRPERVRLLTPFVDHEVKLERWFGRVAANGDQTYRGTVLAIATTTIGSAADLVILKTVDGTVWAISTAQVAYIELVTPPKPTRRPRAQGTAEDAAEAAKVVRAAAKTTRRRQTRKVEVDDAPAA